MVDLECAVSEGQRLVVNGRVVSTVLPVIEAVVTGQVVVARFDPNYDPRGYGTFPNLVAVDSVGELLWIAELPTSVTGDCFVAIKSADPCVANSWTSFECTIDPASGKIEQSVRFE